MSEPDAVPLPREGAVFFDVRGEARSMRLSWYADSAVAVFSIWQGNRCTGTFRLPFGDLDRMVETLQSGPPSRSADAISRQPAGAAFTGHQDGYPVTASHLSPGYYDHPEYAAHGQSADGFVSPGQYRQVDAPAPVAADRQATHGYDDQGYPLTGYHDRPAGQTGHRDRRPAAGYLPAPEYGGPGPQGPPGYRGTTEHRGYGDAAAYPDAGGYTDPHVYQGRPDHQEPERYAAPDYQDRLSYRDPGGLADPHGYPIQPGQEARPGWPSSLPGPSASGYDDSAPFEPGARDPAFSRPAGAGEWLAAPTDGRPPGRHGADRPANPGVHRPYSEPPHGDRQDSDWEAATAAYRAL